MFERFKKGSTRDEGPTRASVEGEDGRFVRDRDGDDRERAAGAGTAVAEDRTTRDIRTRQRGVEEGREIRAHQREEFGGINWGSAFFGWLVAVGMAAILLGLLSAAGAAFGLGEISDTEAEQNAETIGIVGGILLIVVLTVAYYCGGYVSGRMSRFDGGRQGLAVWLLGLAVTIVLAVAGALFGAEYNVLESLNLPRIPIEEGSLTAGAAVALAIVLVATLIAAMGGGKTGERYHKKVDRVGYDRA